MNSAEIQLARAESIRLLRNPIVWLSLVPIVLWVRAAAGHAEREYMLLVGFGFVLTGFVIVAHTVIAVLRARMHRADWLLDIVPVGRDRLSVGHGLAAIAAGLLGVATIAVTYLVFRPTASLGRGDDAVTVEFPRPNVAQLLQGPLAAVAVIALAIAVVRWLPSWLVLIPLAMLTLLQGVWLGVFFGAPSGTAGTWLWPLSTGVVHGEWIGCGSTDAVCELSVSGFDQRTPWWHLGYLAALAALFIVVAVLRHRRDRWVWTALAVSVAAVVAFAIVQAVVHQPYVAALPVQR